MNVFTKCLVTLGVLVATTATTAMPGSANDISDMVTSVKLLQKLNLSYSEFQESLDRVEPVFHKTVKWCFENNNGNAKLDCVTGESKKIARQYKFENSDDKIVFLAIYHHAWSSNRNQKIIEVYKKFHKEY